MPTLRRVEVWPSSGWPERPWSDSPDLDVFARIRRGPSEAYSQALPGLTLFAKASTLRLDIETWHPRPQPELTASPEDMVEVSARSVSSHEHRWIGVPVGFAGHSRVLRR